MDDAATLARIISQPLPRWTLSKVPQATCSPLRKRAGHLDEPIAHRTNAMQAHRFRYFPPMHDFLGLSSHSTCAEAKQQPAGMSGMWQGSKSLGWALDRPVFPMQKKAGYYSCYQIRTQ